MNPKVLIVVASDTRTSHRPAEAVRIAAGVGTWKKTDVSLYLRGPAILAVGEWVDELVDEDNFTRYLPIIGDMGEPVYVEEGSPFLDELGTPTVRTQPIPDARLAQLTVQCHYLLRF